MIDLNGFFLNIRCVLFILTVHTSNEVMSLSKRVT